MVETDGESATETPTPKKKGREGYEQYRKPDYSMGQIQFDRWRDMMNYSTQIGIRVKGGELGLYSLYRGSLYEIYRQMLELFRSRGMRNPLTKYEKKGLIPTIDDTFKKADEWKKKSDNIPSDEDDELDDLKNKFLVKACDLLSDVSGFLSDAIQKCGLGIPTSAILSFDQSKRQTDLGGLM